MQQDLYKFFRICVKVFYNLIGYLIIAPISYLVPKKNYVVLTSRFGDFEGNLKYLFLYLANNQDKDIEVVFLTQKEKVFNRLKEDGFNAWYYPKPITLLRLLRSKVVIVDGNEWAKGLKPFFLAGAKKVQIWHGTGLKTIGLLKPTYQKLSWIHKKFRKENTCYDLLTLSSDFQVESRGKAFKYKDLLINGLPRNDVFFRQDIFGENLVDTSTFEKYREEGYSIVTYTPTWRKYQDNFYQLNLEKLDEFARDHKFKFVIKLHYKHQCDLRVERYQNIIEYDKYADIYPLLAKTDVLITDYSSIYLDFLMLDKPILFYPYDSKEYIDGERALLLDYDETTPGPKVYSQIELQEEISRTLNDSLDDYQHAREKMRKQFFNYVDGSSCERLWKHIKDTLL